MDEDVHATADREVGATISSTAGRQRRWATDKKQKYKLNKTKGHGSLRTPTHRTKTKTSDGWGTVSSIAERRHWCGTVTKPILIRVFPQPVKPHRFCKRVLRMNCSVGLQTGYAGGVHAVICFLWAGRSTEQPTGRSALPIYG